MKEKDEKGYERIAEIEGFFQVSALPEIFPNLCRDYPRWFQMKPYTIEGKPLISGFYVTLCAPWIKDVTHICFQEDWWYDHAYLLRIGETHILWVQKMCSVLSYMRIVEGEELRRLEGAE